MGRYIMQVIGLLFVFAGCQHWTPQRSVDAQNTFISTRYPAVAVSVDSDMAYIGSVKHAKYQRYKNSPGGSTSHYESFLFVLKGPNARLQRGVIIRTKKLSEGYILPDLFDKIKHRLDSGITSFGGQNYQYAVFPSTRPFFDFEENFIFDRGYILSDKFVAKAFSRRDGSDNNYSILIMYIESLDSFGKGRTKFRDWTRREYLSDQQKQFIKSVGETCDQCIMVDSLPKAN